jgi:hypothetical protein
VPNLRFVERAVHYATKIWQEPLFYLLIVPVGLSAAWALVEMILEHRPIWRRCSRALIGALALADVSFVALLVLAASHTHGCPFNGCD